MAKHQFGIESLKVALLPNQHKGRMKYTVWSLDFLLCQMEIMEHAIHRGTVWVVTRNNILLYVALGIGVLFTLPLSVLFVSD